MPLTAIVMLLAALASGNADTLENIDTWQQPTLSRFQDVNLAEAKGFLVLRRLRGWLTNTWQPTQARSQRTPVQAPPVSSSDVRAELCCAK